MQWVELKTKDMKTIPQLKFDEFAAKYCERQVQTPDGLRSVLQEQKQRFKPNGWMLLECAMLGGSRCGELTIMPFGPNNTYKDVPDHPISPRGLASDMSVAVAILSMADL